MTKTTIRRALAGAAAVAALATCGAALAAPKTYTMTVTNQSGTILGAPYSGETLVFTVNADTTTLVTNTNVNGNPGGACVTASSASVKVGAAAPVSITTQTYFCEVSDTYVGLYADAAHITSLHSDNGFSGFDLSVNGGPYVISPGADHNSGLPTLNVTGGTFSLTSGYSSTGGSSITVANGVAPAAVPTLSEWAMILFGTVLAGGAALVLQRRRFTA